MKQLFRSILSVAAAATLLIGCSKDATETPAPAAGEFTLNLVTGADTRTEIYDPGEGKGVNIKWSEGDVAELYINASRSESTASITDNIATFKGSFSKTYMTQAGTYMAQAVYPADARVRYERNEKSSAIKSFGLKLPATQSATTATFDKNADILVSKNMDVVITEDEYGRGEKTVENFSFGRTTAVTRLNFTVADNAELLNSTETVKSIALTVEGKSLAGTFAFDPAAFKYIAATKNSDESLNTDLTPVADPNNMFYENGSNTVTVTLTDTPALKDGFTAWISTAPISLTNGDKLTFTVTTDAGTTITKTATVGKDLAFMTTKLNKMGVKLDGNVTIEKPAVVEPGANAVEFVFSEMGYENAADLTTKNVAKDPITIVFSKGSNSNAPKYYDDGTAVRAYGGNTFTVSGPEGITIRTIELTFASAGDKDNEITTDPTGYVETETGLWSGSAPNVTFTIGGDSGQRRFTKIKVTYDGEAAPVEPVQLATPEVTAEQVPGTTSVKLSWNKVDNATGYGYTIGGVNDMTFDTSVTVPLTAGTYDWSVIAVADNNTQYPDSEPATGSITVEATAADGVATLTSEEMKTMTNNGTSYGTLKTVTNSFGTWETNGRQADDNSYIQLREKTSKNPDNYIKLPELPGYIQSITAEVTNASSPVGGYTGTLFFNQSATDVTPLASAVKVEAGTRSVTIAIDNSTYTSGYIRTKDGAVKIYKLTVNYITSNDPQLVADDITAPAVGDGYTAEYILRNSNEPVTVSGYTGCVLSAEIADNAISYKVDNNYESTTKEGTITLTAGSLTKEIKVTQLASKLTVSTNTVTIANDATTATFTVTSPEFGWAITAPAGITVDQSNHPASKDAVTVTVTYEGTTTGEVGTLTVQRNATNDPQKAIITVNKAAESTGDTKTATIDLSALSAQGYKDGDVVSEITEGSIKVTFNQGDGQNPPKYYSKAVRLYGKNSLTFTGATITKIELTATTNSYNKKLTVVKGDSTYVTSGSTGTWENAAGSTEVELQNGETSHARYTKIVVTYN